MVEKNVLTTSIYQSSKYYAEIDVAYAFVMNYVRVFSFVWWFVRNLFMNSTVKYYNMSFSGVKHVYLTTAYTHLQRFWQIYRKREIKKVKVSLSPVCNRYCCEASSHYFLVS